jgi:hypothetical protein
MPVDTQYAHLRAISPWSKGEIARRWAQRAPFPAEAEVADVKPGMARAG